MGARGESGHELPRALCGLRPQAVAVSFKRFPVPDKCVVLPEVEPFLFCAVKVETLSRGERRALLQARRKEARPVARELPQIAVAHYANGVTVPEPKPGFLLGSHRIKLI